MGNSLAEFISSGSFSPGERIWIYLELAAVSRKRGDRNNVDIQSLFFFRLNRIVASFFLLSRIRCANIWMFELLQVVLGEIFLSEIYNARSKFNWNWTRRKYASVGWRGHFKRWNEIDSAILKKLKVTSLHRNNFWMENLSLSSDFQLPDQPIFNQLFAKCKTPFPTSHSSHYMTNKLN